MKNLSAIKPNEDDYFLIYRKRKKDFQFQYMNKKISHK